MKTKVNIFSPGRFHVCDLARELDKRGFDVKFYSFVPSKRAEKFGLPRHCSCSVLIPMAPFLALERVLFKGCGWAKRLSIRMQDWISYIIMRKCDICICMSGNFIKTPKKAKMQGAIVIMERGSKHVIEQKAVLDAIPNSSNTVPKFNYRRELESYEIADYIAIASQHVLRSFQKHNYPEQKLFINPYGVDLSMFKPMPNVKKEYDVIMVGGWGYRKGCDLIVEALKDTNLTFLHVGGLVDMEFPNLPNFTHVPPVDQSKLVEYYNKAKIFVFPSREDGFGMVLSQAVACNLSIVGSNDCGAPDLKNMVEMPEYIRIIEDYTPQAVLAAINESIKTYDRLDGRVYAGKAVDMLTWEAYGERYSKFINSISGGGNVRLSELEI